jgi:hypothetical protein
MTPTKQTLLHDPKAGVYGNCFTACMASLLDLPIEAVPHFTEMIPVGPEWVDLINGWLRRFGLAYLEFEITDVAGWKPFLDGLGYHVLSGPSPRHEGATHAVIARGGAMVFDPHPSDEGLGAGFRSVGFLIRRCGG